MKNQILHTLAQVFDPNQVNIPRQTDTSSVQIQGVLQIVFGVTGAIALLIVTIAGFQYTLSQGDPQKTAKAKDTILYAVIGLVISMSAFGIVTFVVDKL
ncbi:MAG: MMCAP2_0565 family pilin-like conjugal transfer protein [Candidatus Saccharimonadales bacterium]